MVAPRRREMGTQGKVALEDPFLEKKVGASSAGREIIFPVWQCANVLSPRGSSQGGPCTLVSGKDELSSDRSTPFAEIASSRTMSSS